MSFIFPDALIPLNSKASRHNECYVNHNIPHHFVNSEWREMRKNERGSLTDNTDFRRQGVLSVIICGICETAHPANRG